MKNIRGGLCAQLISNQILFPARLDHRYHIVPIHFNEGSSAYFKVLTDTIITLVCYFWQLIDCRNYLVLPEEARNKNQRSFT